MATRVLKVELGMEFPQTVHSWTVKKEGNFLIATTTSKASGANARRWEFPFKKGILYFYNGMENAYSYFRSSEFQEALNSLGITAVKKLEEPFEVDTSSHNSGWGSWIREILATDGKTETFDSASEFEGKKTGNACFDIPQKTIVKDATYVLYKNHTNYRDNKSQATILYIKRGFDAIETINKITKK